jgi:hypothetical protein
MDAAELATAHRRGALAHPQRGDAAQPEAAGAAAATVEEQARVASEQVLSDSTLARGDIIVTTKGLFKGQKSEQRLTDDFEAVQSSGLARPGDAGK